MDNRSDTLPPGCAPLTFDPNDRATWERKIFIDERDADPAPAPMAGGETTSDWTEFAERAARRILTDLGIAQEADYDRQRARVAGIIESYAVTPALTAERQRQDEAVKFVERAADEGDVSDMTEEQSLRWSTRRYFELRDEARRLLGRKSSEPDSITRL